VFQLEPVEEAHTPPVPKEGAPVNASGGKGVPSY
jgi:hypothetical protein